MHSIIKRKNKAKDFPSFLFYLCIADTFPRTFTGIMTSFICRNPQFFILHTHKELLRQMPGETVPRNNILKIGGGF